MSRIIVDKHKTKQIKKKMTPQDFNEVRQFAYVLRAERERVLIKPINYMI